MAEASEDTSGECLVLLERNKKTLTRTVTSKAEDQAIRDDNFISPAGLSNFI